MPRLGIRGRLADHGLFRFLEVFGRPGDTRPPIRIYAQDGVEPIVLVDEDGNETPYAPAGATGASFLHGEGPPDDEDGEDEQFYLDVDTGDVYVKIAGSWT